MFPVQWKRRQIYDHGVPPVFVRRERAGAIVGVTGSVFIELLWPRVASLLGAQGA